MARPKSDDKRNSILASATHVFALNGLSASTASITKDAGLAEGTLFVYFKGKDELINELYLSIKLQLAATLMEAYPSKAGLRARIQHVWNRYVDWGVANPEPLAVVHKIMVWEGLKPETCAATVEAFGELHTLTEQATEQGLFQDIPNEFITAQLTAQAETTMLFMKREPKKAKLYKEKGFEIFWNGISRKN